jgi:hypothetical protein
VRRLAVCLSVLLLFPIAPAAAGTYDVTTCSTSGPGGVNNAWTTGTVGRVDFGPPNANDLASYDAVGSCATGGLVMQSGGGTQLASWGTSRTFDFVAPAGTQIARLVLWRDASVRQTSAGGRWATSAFIGDGSPLGGPFGPDQCKPGFGFPNPCATGAPGFGANAISRYDLATSALHLGLECGSDNGQIAGCDTPGPQGYFRLKAAVVTIRDDTSPRLEVAGSLLDDGWHRGDADLAYTATDNTGIRAARLLLDGTVRSREDVTCDYTRPLPCANASNRRLGLGGDPIPDGQHELAVVVEDAAGNPTATAGRTVAIDSRGPDATLTRASGRTITVSVADGASGVAGGTIAVRTSVSEPFRALPTTFSGGRLTAKLDRGSAARVGIAISVGDNAGNVTAGEMSELSLRVGGRALRGGAASVGYRRTATFSGRLTTRDGVALAGQPVAVEATSRAAGSSPTPVGTVTTDARGRFAYRAPAGPSRRLRFTYPGSAGHLTPLTRTAQLRVRASSTIHASPRTLLGGGRVRFSGRLGLFGAKVPRSGKLVDLQAFDRGRWRTFATARARGSRGAWSSTYRFGDSPGRYRVRLRIRREDVFPYDLGYSRSVIVRVR